MEPTRQQILNSIESLFIRYDQEGVTYKLTDGDGEKGVAYLGYKLYRGIFEDFKRMLVFNEGQNIPMIEHLVRVGGSWDQDHFLRELLLSELLNRQGLVVSVPTKPTVYLVIGVDTNNS